MAKKPDNIIRINSIGRQNINRYREDQKFWMNIWFKNNSFNEYSVMLLNSISKIKKIYILYFIKYNFSSICHLKTKLDINDGDSITVKYINNNFNDILSFQHIL